MKTIQDELREWMRPVSPLTAFAKSLRGEGGADDPSKAAKGEYVDPLKDVDFDELPTDVKTRLEALRTDFKKQFDTNVELEERRKKAEAFARQEQSRADKATAIVRAHNLPIDGQPAGGGHRPNSADAKIQELQVQLEKDGLQPAQAAAYAKMLATANEIERKNLMQEMAPLFGAVGGLQAQQTLAGAQIQFKDVFSVPELNKAITDNVALLVQRGQPVDDATVKNLVGMAWGQYTLSNPDALKKKDDPSVNGQIPNLGSSTLGSGSHRSNANATRTDGPPVAKQPETLAIMGNLLPFLRQGMPEKKGGK